MLRVITRFLKPTNSQPSLGRWALADNSDIKSTLANIDCCGDRLCGDPYTSREAIDKYTNVKSHAIDMEKEASTPTIVSNNKN